VNAKLAPRDIRVEHLIDDLKDGHVLYHLLEELSGNSLKDYGRLSKGKMRVQWINNVSIVFSYLADSIKTVGIGPTDVVDGNGLVLGLIWSIMVFFFAAEIADEEEQDRLASSMGDELPSLGEGSPGVTEEPVPQQTVSFQLPPSPRKMAEASPKRGNQPFATKAARRRSTGPPSRGLHGIRQALLLWLRSRVGDVPEAPQEVEDLTVSLRDGRILQAVLHSLKPEQCTYEPTGNGPVDLAKALDDAYRVFGVEKLLDPTDELSTSDQRCTIPYLMLLKEKSRPEHVRLYRKSRDLAARASSRELLSQSSFLTLPSRGSDLGALDDLRSMQVTVVEDDEDDEEEGEDGGDDFDASRDFLLSPKGSFYPGAAASAAAGGSGPAPGENFRGDWKAKWHSQATAATRRTVRASIDLESTQLALYEASRREQAAAAVLEDSRRRMSTLAAAAKETAVDEESLKLQVETHGEVFTEAAKEAQRLREEEELKRRKAEEALVAEEDEWLALMHAIHDLGGDSPSVESLKLRVLSWIQHNTQERRACGDVGPVEDLSSDLQDGRALLAVLDAFDPEHCPFEPYGHPKQDLARAVELAHTVFGVSRLLDASDSDALSSDIRALPFLVDLMQALGEHPQVFRRFPEMAYEEDLPSPSEQPSQAEAPGSPPPHQAPAVVAGWLDLEVEQSLFMQSIQFLSGGASGEPSTERRHFSIDVITQRLLSSTDSPSEDPGNTTGASGFATDLSAYFSKFAGNIFQSLAQSRNLVAASEITVDPSHPKVVQVDDWRLRTSSEEEAQQWAAALNAWRVWFESQDGGEMRVSVGKATLLTGAGGSGHTSGDLSDALLHEINRARQSPGAYASEMAESLTHFRDKRFAPPGRPPRETNEGTEAVQEAVASLRALAAAVEKHSGIPGVAPLARHHLMDLAAASHADFLRDGDRTGHTGPQGSKVAERLSEHGEWHEVAAEMLLYGSSDPRELVQQLLTCDGDPSRHNRLSLLSEEFHVCGLATRSHPSLGSVTVIPLAGGYGPKPLNDSVTVSCSHPVIPRTSQFQRVLESIPVPPMHDRIRAALAHGTTVQIEYAPGKARVLFITGGMRRTARCQWN